MGLRLLGDAIHVRLVQPAERSASGLVMLPTTRKPGEVQAIPAVVLGKGPGAVARHRAYPERPVHPVDTSPRVYQGDVLPIDFDVGDVVLLDTRFAGENYIGGERIVRYEEVVGVFGGTEREAQGLL